MSKKTNFTKVEKALEEGLTKITSRQLLEEATLASAKNVKPEELPSKDVLNAVIQSVDRDLKKLRHADEATYKKMGFHRQNLKKLIANPSLLTPQDWKEIKEIRERIEVYKKELAAKLPFQSDDDLIDLERSKHINKRFNVNDKWLPLT